MASKAPLHRILARHSAFGEATIKNGMASKAAQRHTAPRSGLTLSRKPSGLQWNQTHGVMIRLDRATSSMNRAASKDKKYALGFFGMIL